MEFVVTQLVQQIKDGMEEDVFLFNALQIHIIMELNVFVQIFDKNACLGKYLMEFNVFTMRVHVQRIQNGMVLIVFHKVIVQQDIMDQEFHANHYHNFVLLHQFGSIKDVMLEIRVLMVHILKVEIVSLICLVKKDKLGMKT